MKIIDAHHHLWCPVKDTADIGYVWLKNIGAMKPFGDPTSIQRDYLVEEFRAESTNHELIGSVHVQADGGIPDPVKESEWLESLNEKTALPSAHVGFLDLAKPDAQQVLERYLPLKGFRGVRQILSRIDDKPEISFTPVHHLHQEIWRAQYGLLTEHGLSFDLQLYPEQMADAAEFFSQHPNIPVVIDHAGSPYDQSETGRTEWKQGLALMAQLPHCHIKVSGLGMFDQQWSADSVLPLVADIIELFGADRIMYGSNFPVDKLMRSYDFGVDALLSVMRQIGLDNTMVEGIFSKNAETFYHTLAFVEPRSTSPASVTF